MIVGVDEVGRGALAGPVVAAAVVLDPTLSELMTDSKKLSPKKRDHLYDLIVASESHIGIGMVGHRTIDRINILQATLKAMKRAVRRLKISPTKVLIDGNRAPDIPDVEIQTIIKGDATVPAISAASIVAKVLRDRLMCRYDQRYPNYGFALHKGYGTKFHYDQLLSLGPTPIHRRGFCLVRQEPLF